LAVGAALAAVGVSSLGLAAFVGNDSTGGATTPDTSVAVVTTESTVAPAPTTTVVISPTTLTPSTSTSTSTSTLPPPTTNPAPATTQDPETDNESSASTNAPPGTDVPQCRPIGVVVTITGPQPGIKPVVVEIPPVLPLPGRLPLCTNLAEVQERLARTNPDATIVVGTDNAAARLLCALFNGQSPMSIWDVSTAPPSEFDCGEKR
jgi:hypothetical protein